MFYFVDEGAPLFTNLIKCDYFKEDYQLRMVKDFKPLDLLSLEPEARQRKL